MIQRSDRPLTTTPPTAKGRRDSTQRLTTLLVVLALVLSLTSFATHAYPYFGLPDLAREARRIDGGSVGIPWLGIDQEQSLPAWFSSSLLLVCALTLFSVGRAGGERGRRRLPWFALGALFVALSIDEAAGLHERTIVPLRDALGTSGLLYYAWVIPGAILVLVVAAIFLRFVISLPRKTAVLMLVAGATYVGGGLGVETLSAAHAEEDGQENLHYVVLSTLEEALEMLGAILFLRAVLGHRDFLAGLRLAA